MKLFIGVALVLNFDLVKNGNIFYFCLWFHTDTKIKRILWRSFRILMIVYFSMSIYLEPINVTPLPSLNAIHHGNQYKPRRKHLTIITIYGLTEVLKPLLKAKLVKIHRQIQLDRLTWNKVQSDALNAVCPEHDKQPRRKNIHTLDTYAFNFAPEFFWQFP
jgi:hypothetical protein